jgi:hypothetical protein
MLNRPPTMLLMWTPWETPNARRLSLKNPLY